MIRFIIALLFVIVFLILSLPIQGVFYLLGKNPKWKPAIDLASLRIVQWAFRVVKVIAGVKLIQTGYENIPKDEGVLFIANHASFFDIILTYAYVPNLTSFISKKEWEKFPLLPIWMKRLYCLFLDRKDTRQGLKTILTAIDYVKRGISIFIFPEGTRSRDGQFHEFKKGSFKIAQKSGCAIIPVTITGTAEIFEKHLPSLKPGVVTIDYGEPIRMSELSDDDKKHINEYVHKKIEDKLLKKTAEA